MRKRGEREEGDDGEVEETSRARHAITASGAIAAAGAQVAVGALRSGHARLARPARHSHRTLYTHVCIVSSQRPLEYSMRHFQGAVARRDRAVDKTVEEIVEGVRTKVW